MVPALREVETGKVVQEFSGHQYTVMAIAFLTASRVVTGSLDGTIRVWDTASGKEVQRFQGFDKPSTAPSHYGRQVWSLSAPGDGKRIMAGIRDGTVRVFDVATGKQTHCLQGHSWLVNTVSMAANGRRALSGNGDIHPLLAKGSDRTLRYWDLDAGKQIARFKSTIGSVWCVALGADGRVP